MLREFFKKRNSFDFSKPILLIDLRSSSVGGAIVEFSDTHVPLITNISREHYFFEKPVDSSEFVQRTEVALKKVLDNLIHKGKNTVSIGSVEIFYGSPWYKTYINNVQIEETTPTAFSEEYFEILLKKDKDKITDDEIIVEKEVVSVLLNGYKVSNPYDKKATHLDVSFFRSIVNRETSDGFKAIINKFHKTDRIHNHTHPFAMFRALNSKFHNPKNYVILDINGEITEMTLIKDEHFKKVITIPYGAHSFVRRLAEEMKTDFKTSFIKLKSVLQDEKETKTKTQYQHFIQQVKTDWIEAIRKVITDEKIELVPHNIFISGDEEIKEIVINLLNDVEVYAGALKIGRKPQIQFIASNLMKDFCSYKNGLMVVDHQLATEAVFVELLRAHN